MSDVIAASFAKQLTELEGLILDQWAWPSPEAGFALYVYSAAGEEGPLPPLDNDMWPEATVLRYAQSLAASGYLLAVESPTAHRRRTGDWAAALEHLTQRDPFPIDRQSFAYRPMEVVGIALGARECPEVPQETRLRLMDIMSRLDGEGNDDPWSIGLYGLAADVLGIPWNKIIRSPVDQLPQQTLALLKWLLVAHSSTPQAKAASDSVNDLDLVLLQACALKGVVAPDIGRAAVLHSALKRTVSERIESAVFRTWPTSRETTDAINIVEQLCHRFPLFARQLQQRRQDVRGEGKRKKDKRPTIEMVDEYDVQDSMHALLRLHFDDVRPEEWTPSYAAGQSRMDFLLKREKIVIETKMMRPSLSQSEVVNQLSIDEKRYRRHPDCHTLICFVYDPDGRCHNPTALVDDVSLKEPGFSILVIVSPVGI